MSLRIFTADSSVTVAAYSTDQARSNCYYACGGNANTLPFYGVRKILTNFYKCARLSRDLSKIVAGYDTSTFSWAGDARTTMICTSNYLSTSLSALSANTDLMNYLKVSKAELTTVLTDKTADLTDNLVNICNTTRTVDIVTVYLAALLGSPLTVGKIVTGFVYDFGTTYKYPYYYGGVFPIYPPKSVPGYPGIEMAYWTIVSQYTVYTEIYLRQNRDPNWCTDQVEQKLKFCSLVVLETGVS